MPERDIGNRVLFPVGKGTSGAVPVEGVVGGVNENENIAAYGGTATTLGQKAMAASIPVAVANDQTRIPELAAPVDATRTHVPAAATTATVTFAAAGGKRWVLQSLIVWLRSAAATATAQQCTVWDGATGTTILATFVLSLVATANSIDRLSLTNLGLGTTIGNALTIDFSGVAPPANVFEAISAAAYQI